MSSRSFLNSSKTGGRDDDGVAPPADILGDAQEPAARIFLECKDKGLALDLNLLALQGVFLNRRFGLAVRPKPKW